MRLDHVGYRYRRGAPWVLRELSLGLDAGSVIEVTGANGAGKSTLLRVIAGLLRPQRGRVTGRPGSVAYAPERFPADQPFTARAYLSHLAGMRRQPVADMARWAEGLRFNPLLDTPLASLSKGSAQKVNLIQALMADAELLVLDEPFAGLDAATRDALPSLLQSHADAGARVIVSDHQQILRALPQLTTLPLSSSAPLDAEPEVNGAMDRPQRAESETETILEVTVPLRTAATAIADLERQGYQVRRKQ